MFLSMRFYRLVLTLYTYLLPWAAFNAGERIWRFVWNFGDRPSNYPQSGHFGLLLLCSFVWAFMSERCRVTDVDELFRERTGAKATLRALFATSGVLLAVLFFNHEATFPRGLFVCGIFALFTLALTMRVVFRTLFRRHKSWGKATSILIIGADSFAQRAAERLQRLSLVPCQIAGYVLLPGQVPVAGPLYEFDQLGKLNATHGFQEVIIAVEPLQFPRIPEIVEILEKLSLPARVIMDLGDGVVVRDRLFQFGRFQMLDLTSTPADLVNYAVLKRIFDIAFSLVVLIPITPLLALIALLIRIGSPGPVFFSQERIGLNGQPFRMYKFRTMRVSAKNDSDTVWTSANDPRRTRLGTFLRRTSLDELPQFLNVLKGDMSVVGPRPERPYFVDKFMGEVHNYNHRHALKVGITGWAQVHGWRGDTSIDKRVEHDLYYLQNWSLAFDLKIVAMTLVSTLTSKQAY